MLKNPIFVAMDLDDPQAVLKIAKETKDFVGGFKLGPRLIQKTGASLVSELAAFAPVFVDNKYFDIPNTMEGAVRATFHAGASFCTIHAQAGKVALERMAEVEAELNKERPFKLLSVTVLTSFSQEGLPPTSSQAPIADQVKDLAKLTFDSGLSGLVCSPFEVADLASQWSEPFYVTPGVRIGAIPGDDQSRVKTPVEALKEGAKALVIGRPIYKADDPVKAAAEISESIQGAF